MRISCHSLDDFFANLKGEAVFLDHVYVERVSKPLSGDNKRDAVSFGISLFLSAILDLGEAGEGQALLVAAVECGIDRHTQDGTLEGTRQFIESLQRLTEFCNEEGLKIKPGILDA